MTIFCFAFCQSNLYTPVSILWEVADSPKFRPLTLVPLKIFCHSIWSEYLAKFSMNWLSKCDFFLPIFYLYMAVISQGCVSFSDFLSHPNNFYFYFIGGFLIMGGLLTRSVRRTSHYPSRCNSAKSSHRMARPRIEPGHLAMPQPIWLHPSGYSRILLQTRGRILGRNLDKNKSFPSWYSQSPQLCLEISISSNSRNLLQFLYTVKEKEENLLAKYNPLPMV